MLWFECVSIVKLPFGVEDEMHNNPFDCKDGDDDDDDEFEEADDSDGVDDVVIVVVAVVVELVAAVLYEKMSLENPFCCWFFVCASGGK